MTKRRAPMVEKKPKHWEQQVLGWRWLYPGVRLKRWLLLMILSAVVMSVGLSGQMGDIFRNFEIRLVDIRPLAHQIQSLRFIDFFLLVLGIAGVILAIRRALYSVLTVLMPAREKEYPTVALKRLRLKRGPKLVAIGGGTGLPALLSGLKEYSSNISAIVTMSDDGGSSGRLRREYKVLPPGDLRNCLVALAETGSPVMSQLFQHRFKGQGGGIEGHAFGNLFITALSEVTGDFASGIKAASQVLAISGQVLPVTLDAVTLEAELQDGTKLKGESLIGKSQQPISRVHLIPAQAKPNPEALTAIREADAIILGPGSLYTSLLPNLLVPGITEAITASRAVKIFVCNVMTQPGETDGMGLAGHVRAMREHTGQNLVQFVVANTEIPGKNLLARYRETKAELVLPRPEDSAQLDEWGITLIRARLAAGETYIRHDSGRLARVILRLIVI